ncbi:uncharacterized protein LOC134240745 [Saccostrea cucullata]|uniref:uncharacterized protein LOC134240745 n=1 Tax=Saccostrea cuccullata TaxID=36930 RepID=UPI002ED2ED39
MKRSILSSLYTTFLCKSYVPVHKKCQKRYIVIFPIKRNSNQPSNERHRNYSDAVYCDPVECIDSNRKWEEFPKGILNPESLRRESQRNHSDFDQTSYSHLNEKGETDVILETNYDPVNFTQNAAKQPVNYDVCMAVDIPDAEKSFYELQEPFEQT